MYCTCEQILNRKIPKLLEEFRRALLTTLESAFLQHYTLQDLRSLAVDQGRIERAAQVFKNQVRRSCSRFTSNLVDCIWRRGRVMITALSVRPSASGSYLTREM